MKTRLGAKIGMEAAAQLYRAFLADISDRFSRDPAWDFYWAFEPASSAFVSEIARGAAAFPQRPGDLGERMAAAMEHLYGQGYREVVLIGSDLPHLPRERITRAFAWLSSGSDLVLGPAEDGGYYLIGARSVPPVFSGVRWGGSDVLSQTLARAHSAGWKPAFVESTFDLDQEADLRRLLSDADALREVPATRAVLQAIFAAVDPR